MSNMHWCVGWGAMKLGWLAKTALAGLLLGSFFITQASPRSDGGGIPADTARDYFTDTVLQDQDGRSHRFYSDLIAGRTVIINEIFTGCRSSCPLIMAQLADLQELLGDRRGQVKILSISVDPVLDTPQALRAYSEIFHARPGWYFLTGTQTAVSTVLRRLGERSSNPEDHNNFFVIGNDATGSWVKLTAIATAEDLAQAVEEVAIRK
jgi:protein SCO1